MLEIKNIYKKFNLKAGFFAKIGSYVYAINGVNLHIKDNETYGLVGESGCGKTTVARLAVQMYSHDSGDINYISRDKDVFKIGNLRSNDLKRMRSKIKYIFQDPARSLNPRMNILDILTNGYKYSGMWPGKRRAREEAEKILIDVGIPANDLDRRPADFSGGQRQRISIARALIIKPELLICDEVVSALDVSIQSQILHLLLKLKDEYKLSYLFIAHDLSIVSYFCDRIGVMYAGTIVEEATAKELIKNRIHPYTSHLYSSIPNIKDKNNKKFVDNEKEFISMPDPTLKQKGCPYYNRCALRKDICKDEKPISREISKEHYVSCHCV